MKGRAATHVVVYFTLGKRGDAKRVRLVVGHDRYEMLENTVDALGTRNTLWSPIAFSAPGMPAPGAIKDKALRAAFGPADSPFDQPGVTWVDGRVEIEIEIEIGDITP